MRASTVVFVVLVLTLTSVSALTEHIETPKATHSTIAIDGNSGFTSANGVTGGSGTQTDPYIISNWEIDAQGSAYCIKIMNTDAYFMIYNCTAKYANNPWFNGIGIWLDNVTHGKIYSCTVASNCEAGIKIANSNNITVMYNLCDSNTHAGIAVENSTDIYIANNTCRYDESGILLITNTTNTVIENNSIYSCNLWGIYLEAGYFGSVSNNTIRNNSCSFSGNYGLWFYGAGMDNRIIGNIFYENPVDIQITNSGSTTIAYNTCNRGISIEDSIGMHIHNNTLYFNGLRIYGLRNLAYWNTHIIDTTNTVDGVPVYYARDANGTVVNANYSEIILANCTNSSITNQTLSAGLWLGFSSNLTVANSTVSNEGVHLTATNYSVLTNCTVTNGGIDVLSSSYTVIQNCTVTNAEVGINIRANNEFPIIDTEHITVESTKVFYNRIGLGIDIHAYHCYITQNTFVKNRDWAIVVNGAGNNINTNNFILSGIHAVDNNEQSEANMWYIDATRTGNYWDDWNGQNWGTPNAYTIPGSAHAHDMYPLNHTSTQLVSLAPINLQITSGPRCANLSWNPPEWNGSADILNYTIYYGTASANYTNRITVGNITNYTVTNLTNGVVYYFAVSATNAIGESPKSSEERAFPMDVPSPPKNLSVTQHGTEITLSWEPPADDGGSSVWMYNIYRNGTYYNSTYGTTYNDTIEYGVNYRYYVTAINSVGESLPSNEINQTFYAIPDAPRTLQAIAGNRSVNLTWEPPEFTGGSPVTAYKIYYGTASGIYNTNITVNNTTNYLVTNLTNGIRYYFAVSALNAAGEGAKSAEANATPLALPWAPRNLRAIPGDKNITLSWEPPEDNGGTAITSYRIYRGTESGAEVYLTTVGNVLTYTDYTVTYGLQYYYQVSAVNALGEGTRSAEVPVFLGAVPGTPRNVHGMPANGGIILTWNEPETTGGMPITNYTIYYGTSRGNYTNNITVGNVTNYTLTGLKNGEVYYIAISAINAVGEGAKSTEIKVIPCTVPSAPRNVTAVVQENGIRVRWEPPEDDGGATITGYKLYYGTKPGSYTNCIELGVVTEYTLTNLTSDTVYYIAVSAVNSAGEGARSTEVSTAWSPSEPISPNIRLLFLVLILIVLAIISLVLGVLYYMRKRKRAQESVESVPTTEPEKSASTTQSVTVPTAAPAASAKPQVKADETEVLRYLEQHGGSADRKKVVSYLCLHGIDGAVANELVTKLIQDGKIKEDGGKLILNKV